MEKIHTFPDHLADADLRDSFLEDLSIALTQLSAALDRSDPEATADKSCMAESLKAMHMLRGAAGALDFKLAFKCSEVFHRLAEIGQSFAENLRPEFLKIFQYLKEAETLLQHMGDEVQEGFLSQSPKQFTALYQRIERDYGDYFYDRESDLHEAPSETPSAPVKSASAEEENDDLEAFLASIPFEDEADDDDASALSPEPTSPTNRSSDIPAEWDVLQYFYQEADENLAAMEQALLSLERGEGGESATNEILRLTHSTKGAANSMGMFRIAKLMHATEELFLRASDNEIELQPDEYSVILATTDLIREILDETRSHSPIEGLSEKLEKHFQALDSIGEPRAPLPEPVRPETPAHTNQAAETETTPTTAGGNLSAPAEPLPHDEAIPGAPLNTFRIDAAKIDSLMNTVGELIISRTRMAKKIDHLLEVCTELTKSRTRMRESIEAFSERFEYTNRETGAIISGQPEAEASGHTSLADDFALMEFDRYDDFNILSRRLTEIGNDTDLAIRQIFRGGQDVRNESTQLGSFIGRIQDEISSTRLAPIAILFKRLERSVRDAAHKANCEVRLQTHGDDILLDKSILDDLFQPMLHIVRNGVAHAFKGRETGQNLIRINAHQEGGRILVSVNDNGNGVDFEKVAALARTQGLLSASDTAESHLLEVLFHPGFSTTDVADEVSGRGIGLDAVKADIERLGGSVRIESAQGQGTAFSLNLPLTLAIDRGMYFYVGKQLYVVFMAAVEQVFFSHDVKLGQIGNREVLELDDASIPVIDLRHLFQAPIEENNRREAIILCRQLNNRIALKVDRVFYQDDVVVKNLGPLFENHRYFGAATIYGDGEIVPILDIGRIGPAFHNADLHVREPLPEKETSEKKNRILVVDDSLSVRKICEDYLADSGFLIETANDGLDALNRIKSHSYELILTDLEMPRLNGLELIAELKRRPNTRDIPVIVITSRTTEKHRKKALSLGAAECLGKPFGKESLNAAIAAQLLVQA